MAMPPLPPFLAVFSVHPMIFYLQISSYLTYYWLCFVIHHLRKKAARISPLLSCPTRPPCLNSEQILFCLARNDLNWMFATSLAYYPFPPAGAAGGERSAATGLQSSCWSAVMSRYRQVNPDPVSTILFIAN